MRIASLQVGQVQDLGDWTTATFKYPVPGPIALTRLGLEGDAVADHKNHGGPDKAVLAYAARHYADWRRDADTAEMGPGALGENFTIEGLDEQEVCIGDTFRIGSGVEVQVSQPRQPCWKQARRWGVKDLVVRILRTGRTGWYFRVLAVGDLFPGDTLHLLDRPNPEWTVARANYILHFDKENASAAAMLAALPELSESWKRELGRRYQ